MNTNQPPLDEQKQKPFSDGAPLSEKDFIQDSKTGRSNPWWLWVSLIAAVAALVWGSGSWYHSFMANERKHDPFLEVTNRDFSLFLWQFPSYMRVNNAKKTGFLTGFLTSSENFSPSTAEEFVIAPPDLVFLYQTWNRLLSVDFIERPIDPKDFSRFLAQLPEWQPSNWPASPKEYVELITTESYTLAKNMQVLPQSTLPMVVRQAFIGWKNYFFEGPQINALQPTFAETKAFLDKHPHYGHSYWRNIKEVYGQKVAGESYLMGLKNDDFAPDATVPVEQLSSFLKVAMYNDSQARLGK